MELAGGYVEIASCPDDPEGSSSSSSSSNNGGSEITVEIMALRVSDERSTLERGRGKGPRGFLSPRLSNLGLGEARWRAVGAPLPTRRDLTPHVRVRLSTPSGGGAVLKMLDPPDEMSVGSVIGIDLFETNICPDLKLVDAILAWLGPPPPASPEEAQAAAEAQALAIAAGWARAKEEEGGPGLDQGSGAVPRAVVGSDGSISYRKAAPPSDTALRVALNDVRIILAGDLKALFEKPTASSSSSSGPESKLAEEQQLQLRRSPGSPGSPGSPYPAPGAAGHYQDLSAIIATLNLNACILLQTHSVANGVSANVRPDPEGSFAGSSSSSGAVVSEAALATPPLLCHSRAQRSTMRIEARAAGINIALDKLTASTSSTSSSAGSGGAGGGFSPHHHHLDDGLLPILSQFVPSIVGTAVAAAAAAAAAAAGAAGVAAAPPPSFPHELLPLLSKLDCTFDFGGGKGLFADPGLGLFFSLNSSETALIGLDPKSLINPEAPLLVFNARGGLIKDKAAADAALGTTTTTSGSGSGSGSRRKQRKRILPEQCIAVGPFPGGRKVIKAVIEPINAALPTGQIDLITSILAAWQGPAEAPPPAAAAGAAAASSSSSSSSSSAPTPALTNGSEGSTTATATATAPPASPASTSTAAAAAGHHAAGGGGFFVGAPPGWHEHDYEIVLPRHTFEEVQAGVFAELPLRALTFRGTGKGSSGEVVEGEGGSSAGAAAPFLLLERLPSHRLNPQQQQQQQRGPAYTYDPSGSGAATVEDAAPLAAAYSLGYLCQGDVLVAVNGQDPLEWSKAAVAAAPGAPPALAPGSSSATAAAASTPEEKEEEEERHRAEVDVQRTAALVKALGAASARGRVTLRFRRLPLALDVVVKGISLELRASLAGGRTQPLLRAALSDIRVDAQVDLAHGFSPAADLDTQELEAEAVRKHLPLVSSSSSRASSASASSSEAPSKQLLVQLPRAIARSKRALLEASEQLLKACVRRPARACALGSAGLRLEASTYHVAGEAWEPLLEPWRVSLQGSMLDFGHAQEPTQHLAIDVESLRLTASPTILASLSNLGSSLGAKSSAARASRAMTTTTTAGAAGSGGGGGGGEGPLAPGELRTTSLPASGFPFLLRNETGAALLVCLGGLAAASGAAAAAAAPPAGAGDRLIGWAVSSPSPSLGTPQHLLLQGDAPGGAAADTGYCAEAFLEAAQAAQARGVIPLPFVLLPGYEVGLSPGSAEEEAPAPAAAAALASVGSSTAAVAVSVKAAGTAGSSSSSALVYVLQACVVPPPPTPSFPGSRLPPGAFTQPHRWASRILLSRSPALAQTSHALATGTTATTTSTTSTPSANGTLLAISLVNPSRSIQLVSTLRTPCVILNRCDVPLAAWAAVPPPGALPSTTGPLTLTSIAPCLRPGERTSLPLAIAATASYIVLRPLGAPPPSPLNFASPAGVVDIGGIPLGLAGVGVGVGVGHAGEALLRNVPAPPTGSGSGSEAPFFVSWRVIPLHKMHHSSSPPRSTTTTTTTTQTHPTHAARALILSPPITLFNVLPVPARFRLASFPGKSSAPSLAAASSGLRTEPNPTLNPSQAIAQGELPPGGLTHVYGASAGCAARQQQQGGGGGAQAAHAPHSTGACGAALVALGPLRGRGEEGGRECKGSVW